MNNITQSSVRPPSATPPPTGVRSTFTAADGARLQYKIWAPAAGFSRAVILLHRGHEHADRWNAVVPHLQMPDAAIFAWEARGHGRSAGRRGHADGFMTYVRDLETFVAHLTATHGIPRERLSVIAHSVGAVIAAAWVHDYAPPLAALVLATPAFQVKLYIPGALTGTRWLQKLRPHATIKSFVKGSWLTADPAEQQAYDADPQISRDISARVLVDLFDTSQRVIDDAAVMTPPLLLLSAGEDRVVDNRAHDQFFQSYGGSSKEHLHLPAARHGIFHDVDREATCAAIRRFIEAQPQGQLPRADGDLRGPTHDEFEELCCPPPALSLKGAGFAVQRLAMRTLGLLSDGIRLGFHKGFDSGESLDYVYRNEARGRLGIGPIFDRAYLNAIGWRGIRQRRELLRMALAEAADSVRRETLPAHVADVAGGAGRYLLDFLSAPAGRDFTCTCRDRSPSALAVGRTSAQQLGLATRITHEEGDAFDPASIATIQPRPGIIVVSGLYELFPANALVRRSLEGIFARLPVGGWLLYTCQPWHPQVEMIARVLPNRDGRSWIMRRRAQGEMDALVREAGFTKHAQWTDDYGIFTVAAARKLAV